MIGEFSTLPDHNETATYKQANGSNLHAAGLIEQRERYRI